MTSREEIINSLNACMDVHRSGLWSSGCAFCSYAKQSNPKCYMNLTKDVIELLKEQQEIVRCKDCKYWVPGVITDQDDFIPPKCGKYSQMVGHSADDFCSYAERR